MIRMVSLSSVCATTSSRPGADIPIIKNLRSDVEWSRSGKVVES
jgi:hypothetical protein